MTRTREEWEAAQVARAASWTAFLFNGRGRKHRLDCPSFEEAARAADCLDETFGGGPRRAIVYAVTPEGVSIQVPRR